MSDRMRAGGGGPMPLGFPPKPEYGDRFKKQSNLYIYTGYGLHVGWSTEFEFKSNRHTLFPPKALYGDTFTDPYKRDWVFVMSGFRGKWSRCVKIKDPDMVA